MYFYAKAQRTFQCLLNILWNTVLKFIKLKLWNANSVRVNFQKYKTVPFFTLPIDIIYLLHISSKL